MSSKIKRISTIFFFWSTMTLSFQGFTQSMRVTFDYVDNCTEELRRALNSDADTIVIANQSKPWLLRPMRFANLKNKVIVLENGTELRALPGAFPKTNDALFTFTNCRGIVIIGNESKIVMNKSEYTDGEWRHGISLRGCTDIEIRNITVRDTGGDGIYVAGSRARAYSENIYIDNIKSINNRRQGMTLISVKNIVVKNSLFKDTVGTMPGAGLDIEPNKATDVVTGVEIHDCIFSGNYGSGIMLAFGKSNGSSQDLDITIKNCVLSNNNSIENPRVGTEIRISANKDNPVKGQVLFEECLIENSRWGLLYSRKRADAFKVVFNSCKLKNTSKNGESPTVYLEVPDYYKTSGPLGGYEFNHLFINNESQVNFMTIRGSRLGTLRGVSDITGEITLEKPNPGNIEYINYDSSKNANLELKFTTKF